MLKKSIIKLEEVLRYLGYQQLRNSLISNFEKISNEERMTVPTKRILLRFIMSVFQPMYFLVSYHKSMYSNAEYLTRKDWICYSNIWRYGWIWRRGCKVLILQLLSSVIDPDLKLTYTCLLLTVRKPYRAVAYLRRKVAPLTQQTMRTLELYGAVLAFRS